MYDAVSGIFPTLVIPFSFISRSEDAATESWQGRDPWGDAVNVSLPAGIGKPGLIVPVAIVIAKKHSLIGELRG